MVYERTRLLRMYKKMLEIRRFEEKAVELYAKGFIPGLLHPYIGQEAVAVGVCETLQKTDYVISTHRGHGHSIAKGVSPHAIMAELMGKETGVCKGIGGSMHITDPENGVLFSTAIVGGGIPISSGVGLALKLKKNTGVAACFFGDGATNIGSFHEAINLAALWKLPIIFVCENNQYAVSTSVRRSMTIENIAVRAVAYNIPGATVDGMDVTAVYAAAVKAVERGRKGDGPTLLECVTYRYGGHGAYDIDKDYRTKEEVEEWMRKDPIDRLKGRLLKEGVATEDELDRIDKEVQRVIDKSVDLAIKDPFPTLSAERLYKMVYA